MGLDISQTSTGIACITDTGDVWTESCGSDGRATDTLAMRATRLTRTAETILEFFPSGSACQVLVEDLMMASGTGNKLDRSALWWFVVCGLIKRHYEVSTASPGTLKKWGTGKVSAAKNMLGLHFGRLYPDVEFSNDDEVDAMVAAHLLAVRAGFDVPTRAHHVPANWKSIRFPVTLAS
jgi:Holliday junction resolvasome RuvABC endonuclease subunit